MSPHREFTAAGPLTALAVNPTNELAVIGGRDVLRVLHLAEDGFREALNLHVPEGSKLSPFAPTDIKWSSPSAGNLVATSSTAGIAIYDLARPSAQKLDRVISEHTRAVNRVHFHPNDSYLLLSGSQDGTIKMWDLRTRNSARATIDAKSEGVRDVQFNPLGTLELAAALENGSIQIWDLRRITSCDRRYNAHNGLALSLDWHPNGRILATSGRDKMIKVWDTTHEARKPTHYIQTIASVARVAWRPGAPFEIASCSLSSDYRIYVWHIDRPYVPDISLEKHDNVVSGIVWGARDTVFSCSRDQRIMAHDVARDGYQIRDRLPVSSTSFSASAELSMTLNEPKKIAAESSKGLELERSRAPGGGHLQPGRGLLNPRVLVGHVSTDRVNSKIFSMLARHYATESRKRVESCQINARVAEHLGLHQTAQTWRLIQGLLAMIGTSTSTNLRVDQILDETLRFYADQGNIQFCCTLLLILSTDENYAIDIGTSAHLAGTWFLAYVSQLMRVGLNVIGAKILSSCPIPSVAGTNSTGTTVYSSCTCGKTGLVQGSSGWRCEDLNCRGRAIQCSLCHRPVRGIISWCQGCSHGGHARCLAAWKNAAQDFECPTCGHVCTDMQD